MQIHILHHNTKPTTIEKKFPGAEILDVTSKGAQPWVKFSPFYPHGGIPVPFTPDHTSESVEGIWQGLKVFANSDVDSSVFKVQNMRGLKRTQRRFGTTPGHRNGLHGHQLLDYLEARRAIYLPTYLWVLEYRLQPEVERLRELTQEHPIVLLDYETNTDASNPAKPLSHAALIRAYLLNEWPAMDIEHAAK